MRSRIEEKAAKLLEYHGVTELPVPVERLAAAEGIRITRVRFDGTESGFAMTTSGMHVIGVNQSNHPRRQRFTIAHELGHLLLHHDDGDSLTVDRFVTVSFRDDVSRMAISEEEIEANAFAAALLMPRDHLQREVYAAYEAGVKPDQLAPALARRFDVSKDAMGFRLINLGLVSV